jgi:predicted DNA-binding transcriptional regulator YafY
MPLTHLQKRWLKAISLDPRFALFCDGISGLEDVKPLYRPEDIIYYDQAADGDKYADPEYKARFRIILRALRESRRLRIAYVSGKGRRHNRWFYPHKLEYSIKDDKFRLYVLTNNSFKAKDFGIINLSRILFAELGEPFAPDESILPTDDEMKLSVELIITNERNALERAMLHFANYQKQTEKLDEDIYRMKLWYYRSDETEVLIRVIAFGPFIRAVSPDRFVEQIRQRLARQQALTE